MSFIDSIKQFFGGKIEARYSETETTSKTRLNDGTEFSAPVTPRQVERDFDLNSVCIDTRYNLGSEQDGLFDLFDSSEEDDDCLNTFPPAGMDPKKHQVAPHEVLYAVSSRKQPSPPIRITSPGKRVRQIARPIPQLNAHHFLGVYGDGFDELVDGLKGETEGFRCAFTAAFKGESFNDQIPPVEALPDSSLSAIDSLADTDPEIDVVRIPGATITGEMHALNRKRAKRRVPTESEIKAYYNKSKG